MTLFVCRCGDVHDTAERGPCDIVFPIPGLFALSRLDRFYIIGSLRSRHPNPSPDVIGLIDRLKPNDSELREWLNDDIRVCDGELRRRNPVRRGP